MGSNALLNNTTGAHSTAAGDLSLQCNTSGSNNTALGQVALAYNTTCSENTAVGQGALLGGTGSNNTAIGYEALDATSTGSNNTASGALALFLNTSGNANTASGNTADGYSTLSSNTSGYSNVAVGVAAMNSNTTGFQNAAFGINALLTNSVGSDNIAVGFSAGSTTTGNNNIDIGNVGSAGENGVIRIGTPGTHGTTYVAGIPSSKVTGAAVYVTSSGQLGTLASSERYKTEITPMDDRTEKLQRLRSVTFHLKSDPGGAVQYGLIAEEVDKVYPELVIRDERGTIEGVRYDELAPMLLNVVQRQQQQLTELKRQNESMLALLRKLDTEAPPVARR